MDPLSCAEYRSQLADVPDDARKDAQESALSNHYDTCDTCRAWAERHIAAEMAQLLAENHGLDAILWERARLGRN